MMRIAFLIILIFFTAFAAFAAPQVTSVTPDTGWTFGATRVNVIGTGFIEGAATVYCNVPGVICPVLVWFGDNTGAVTSVSPTQIDVYAPGQNLATVDVRVQRVDASGESTLANGFHYKADTNPGPLNYQRYLVPVTGPDVFGAHGSQWRAELTLHNDTDDVTLYPLGDFCNPILLAPCIAYALPPQATDQPILYPAFGSFSTGSFLYIPLPLAGSVQKQLRVRDVSRSNQSMGAEVPIVPDDEFARRLVLLDIPTDAKFRASLRIYRESEAPGQAFVRVLRASGSEVLAVMAVDLAGLVTSQPSQFSYNPAYARVDPITEAVRQSGESRVRIEIATIAQFPDEFGVPLWAFVTITNNETQEVTVISPQR